MGQVRVTVEQSSRKLKGRWRILLKRTEQKTFNIPDIVGACCILHNICDHKTKCCTKHG
ncbi:UNVERIFIED_CONTAM: hypothetical protein FKN15_009623 [Acipenser sinensis]